MNEHIDRQIDQAEQDARRVRKVSRMIPTKGPLSDDLQTEIAQNVRHYCNANGVADSALAKALGTSQTYISNVLSPTSRKHVPAETADRLLRQLNDWIEEHNRSREVRRPDNFVKHDAARRFIRAADNTRSMGCIGVAWGRAGIGKSTTVQYLSAPDSPIPGAFSVEIDDDCRSGGGLRYAIYDACRSRRGHRAHVRMADLLDRLRDSDRLLMLDQAHLMRLSAWQTVMSLHDKARLPILLVGTFETLRRAQGDKVDQWIGQFSSRIGWIENLNEAIVGSTTTTGRGKPKEWISIEELRRMYEGKLKLHPDALRMLLPIALGHPGLLRECKYAVRLAEAAARGAKRAFVSVADMEYGISRRHKVQAVAAAAQEAVTA